MRAALHLRSLFLPVNAGMFCNVAAKKSELAFWHVIGSQQKLRDLILSKLLQASSLDLMSIPVTPLLHQDVGRENQRIF